jgi:hypothetical protein
MRSPRFSLITSSLSFLYPKQCTPALVNPLRGCLVSHFDREFCVSFRTRLLEIAMARTANLLQSNLVSPADRLDEVARLLALGYLRLRARRQAKKANEPNHLSEFELDFGAEGSVCDTDAHADRERR